MKDAIFSQPAPGFDAPLDMLRACHGRILKQLDTLIRLGKHLRENGFDEAARVAARQVHHYFSTAGEHHHQDEEEDLFPLLEGKTGFSALLSRLRSDHEEMSRCWKRVEPLLAAPDRITDLDAFEKLGSELLDLYQKHIDIENNDLLPRAKNVLEATQLADLGASMARRRGVTLE